MSADPAALRLAADVVGPERLLYGSDSPYSWEFHCSQPEELGRTIGVGDR
ncbi:hypothetical protein H7I92_06885 [Mycobacterium riyadhense]|nr:hypothetical protein [Mycobacterium riyadhense]